MKLGGGDSVVSSAGTAKTGTAAGANQGSDGNMLQMPFGSVSACMLASLSDSEWEGSFNWHAGAPAVLSMPPPSYATDKEKGFYYVSIK